jgi:hypothetical protein
VRLSPVLERELPSGEIRYGLARSYCMYRTGIMRQPRNAKVFAVVFLYPTILRMVPNQWQRSERFRSITIRILTRGVFCWLPSLVVNNEVWEQTEEKGNKCEARKGGLYETESPGLGGGETGLTDHRHQRCEGCCSLLSDKNSVRHFDLIFLKNEDRLRPRSRR